MELSWPTFFLEIINFLVLVWILKRFLYKPVLEAVAHRKAVIDKTLADANAKEAGAQALARAVSKSPGAIGKMRRKNSGPESRKKSALNARK